MPSSTGVSPSQWSIPFPRRRSSQSLIDVQRLPAPPTAQAWPPIHVCPFCQRAFQDARLYWSCIHHHLAKHHSSHLLGLQQHPSPRSGPVIVWSACPHCRQRPKLPDHRFCSVACGRSAARSAPQLIYLPPYHELYVKVATQLLDCWKSESRPTILGVYMITWTESQQRSFEQYRGAVEARGQFMRRGCSSGNEQKRFRSTSRACTLGERGNLTPCRDEACWLCETIRCGFLPHLERKRSIPWNGPGIRLGAGIYTSHTSSKADDYAVNVRDPSSSMRAMLVCRVVIGTPYVTCCENPTLRSPPQGYDCVYGKPGSQSHFTEDEFVVYDADAIRAAYLVLYDKGRDA